MLESWIIVCSIYVLVGKVSQISWRAIANASGEFSIEATTGTWIKSIWNLRQQVRQGFYGSRYFQNLFESPNLVMVVRNAGQVKLSDYFFLLT